MMMMMMMTDKGSLQTHITDTEATNQQCVKCALWAHVDDDDRHTSVSLMTMMMMTDLQTHKCQSHDDNDDRQTHKCQSHAAGDDDRHTSVSLMTMMMMTERQA